MGNKEERWTRDEVYRILEPYFIDSAIKLEIPGQGKYANKIIFGKDRNTEEELFEIWIHKIKNDIVLKNALLELFRENENFQQILAKFGNPNENKEDRRFINETKDDGRHYRDHPFEIIKNRFICI